jgi:hypothetical protein
MNDDDATLYRKLRLETIGLLNFDPAALTTAQAVRVDLVASLRLALDHFTAMQLSGEKVDTAKLLSCAESLERLLPRTAATEGVHESHSARRRLLELINEQAAVAEEDRDAEIAGLRQLLAEKTAALTVLLGEASASTVSHDVSKSDTNSVTDQPPQRSPQPPLSKPSSGPPAHYLRQADEPWRSHLGPDGSIRTPGAPPGSSRSPRTW